MKTAGASTSTEDIEGWTPNLVAKFHHKQLSVVSDNTPLKKDNISVQILQPSIDCAAIEVESRSDEEKFSPGMWQNGVFCDGCFLVSFGVNTFLRSCV